jgi:hypothetical protein
MFLAASHNDFPVQEPAWGVPKQTPGISSSECSIIVLYVGSGREVRLGFATIMQLSTRQKVVLKVQCLWLRSYISNSLKLV